MQSISAASEQVREALTTVSEPVIQAVEKLSRRQPVQTVPDISAAAGIPLNEANDEAVKLALLTGAAIDVSDAGDLAYRFPNDIRGALRSKSLALQVTLAWRKSKPALYTAARISFGVLLFVSIIVTFISITALSAAAQSQSRDDDRRSNRMGLFFTPRFFFGPDIFDVLFYSSYYNSNSAVEKDPSEMSFLESVYSCVFGDGDVNAQFEEKRWRAIAGLIRANNGAVTGDQLAPFLDALAPSQRTDESNLVDEQFVLPALTRFQGHPEVTPDGDIIYVFPSLSSTGQQFRVDSIRSFTNPPLESNQVLSRATGMQKFLVAALGAVNALAVLVLGAKLGSVVAVTPSAAALVATIAAIYPFLLAYAATFAIAPIVRWLAIKRANAEIDERNSNRLENARWLSLKPVEVERKLQAAQKYAVDRQVFKQESVSYSSDRDAIDQVKMQDDLQDEFDRRLNGKL